MHIQNKEDMLQVPTAYYADVNKIMATLLTFLVSNE